MIGFYLEPRLPLLILAASQATSHGWISCPWMPEEEAILYFGRELEVAFGRAGREPSDAVMTRNPPGTPGESIKLWVKTVRVYRFRWYDINTNGNDVRPLRGPRWAILAAKGEILEDTVEEIAPDLLDRNGFIPD